MSTLQIEPFTASQVRIRVFGFLRLLWAHVRVHWLSYVLVALLWQVLSANYRLGFNETVSLPQTVFVIHKGQSVVKGDYVAFTVPPAAAKHFSNPNAILTKIVLGVEGDVVSVQDRIVHVNGKPVGYAKPFSLKGEKLDPIQESAVPFGYVYVAGLHRDSLDSRYTIVGLVPYTSVVGKATPLF